VAGSRRLRQVVVGARVQAGDPVLNPIARREHEHRRPDPRVAQSLAGLEAREAGEHDVEDDRVVRMCLCHPDRVLAGGRHVGRMAVFLEPAAHQAGHLDVVFDHEHAHEPILIVLP
jgi:hypothetical protein